MDIRRVMRCFVTLAVLAWCGVARAEDFSNASKYGNKTANLAKLNQSCSQPIKIGAAEYTVKVPDFIGIAHDHMHVFLQEKIKIDEQWDALCAPYRDGAVEILANKKLPDDFLIKAEALGEQIKQACVDAFELTKEQLDFISKASVDTHRLMVRSTGKEDTDKMANAGGNTTVINVAPTVQAIRSAIGEVVASYIGRKSLSQRVSVAQSVEHIEELFERPFMPVLLQVMIGESRGGQQLTSFEDVATLPVPGVMFTTEAEGFTDGLVHIQTTFGHNEGVVNSLVPVDTWYVSEHNTVFPIVRHKHERLVPGAHGLERKKNILQNGEAFGFLPSLNGELAQAIAQAGRVIEKHYEMPMDVEFVLMPQARTIYLVQARPIVKGEKNPTYIDDAFVSGKKAMQCSKVGVGRAEVAIAASADGIMVYETLAQALNTYLQKKSDERNAIKCVVVQQAPAATSHEATTFRSFNMPVMQHNNVGSVTGWLASQKGQIVVDPQRGLLLATDEQIAPVSGWFESPLPRQLSVGVVGGVQTPKKALVLLKLKKIDDDTSPEEFFEKLKNPQHKAEAKRALLGVLKHLSNTLVKVNLKTFGKSVIDKSLLANVDLLMASKNEFAGALMVSFLLAAEDYLNNIEPLADAALARNRNLLYPVLFMQTLYNQKLDPQIVAPISLATLLAGVKRDVRAAGLSSTPVQSVAMLDMLKIASDYGFSPEIKDRWARFTNGLSPEVMAELEPQMEILHGLGSMPMFINVIFPSMYKQGDDAVGVVRQIVELMEHNAKSFETLQEMQQKIAGWDVSVFADPAAFTKQWSRFKQELLHYFMSDDFTKMFQPLEKNNLVQMTALSVMHKMVDVFDTSIKSLKGSTEYVEVQQKVNNVHTMVVAYWNLFERWVKFLPQDIFPVSAEAEYWQKSEEIQDVDKYCEIMNYFITAKAQFVDFKALEPSKGFNVTLAAIGSAGRIDEVLDNSYKQNWTLEDYFTLSHQNLLVVMSYLLRQVIDVNSLLLPGKVKEVMEMFNAPFNYQKGLSELYVADEFLYVADEFKASLVGIVLSHNDIVIHYNIPLRGHSAGFVLSYNFKQERIELLGNFYRNLERPTIFNHIALYGDILDIYADTKLLSSTVVSNATYLRWNVSNANIARLQNALTRMLILMYPESENIQLPDEHWQMIYRLKDNLVYQDNLKIVLSALAYHGRDYQIDLSSPTSLILPIGFDELLQSCINYFIQNIEQINLLNKAKELLKEKHLVIQEIGVKLFQFLFSKEDIKELAFKEALRAAQSAVSSEVFSVRSSGIALFKELFEKGQGFEQASKAAGDAVGSESRHVQRAGIALFKELFAKDKGFDDAIKVAVEAVNSKSDSVRSAGIALFVELVKKGEVLDDAIKVAVEAVNSKSDSVCSAGIALFKELFAKDKGFDDAIKVAVEAVNSKSDSVRSAGFGLFKELFEKGQGFDGAIKAAGDAVKSEEYWVRQSGVKFFKELLELFKELVNQGNRFDEAIKAAVEAVNSKSDSVRSAGIELFEFLLLQKDDIRARVIKEIQQLLKDNTNTKEELQELIKND